MQWLLEEELGTKKTKMRTPEWLRTVYTHPSCSKQAIAARMASKTPDESETRTGENECEIPNSTPSKHSHYHRYISIAPHALRF